MQSIFLSCVFFPFWTQLENSTTKGEEKKNHVTNSTTKDKWKHLLKSSSLWPLLRTVIFCIFGYRAGTCWRSIAMLFYFILILFYFFEIYQMRTIFFHPKKSFLYVSKKSYFIFFRSKEFKNSPPPTTPTKIIFKIIFGVNTTCTRHYFKPDWL